MAPDRQRLRHIRSARPATRKDGVVIHTDNQPIKFLSMSDQSRLYIGLLWSHRSQDRIRAIIRGHVRMIRRWAAQS